MKLLNQMQFLFLQTFSLHSKTMEDPFLKAEKAYAVGNYTKAAKLFLDLAQQGDSYAQFRVGLMYYSGRGINVDYAQSHKWAQLSAEQGNDRGQLLLATLYSWGHGVAKNEKVEFHWTKLAADQGNSDAQCRLGGMYSVGVDGNPNYSEALRWYRLAAEKGSAGGFFGLSDMYRYGTGVPEDDELSKFYGQIGMSIFKRDNQVEYLLKHALKQDKYFVQSAIDLYRTYDR